MWPVRVFRQRFAGPANQWHACAVTPIGAPKGARTRMHEVHPKSILEAALLTAQRPLALRELHDLVGEGTPREELRALLDGLSAEWHVRGSLQLAETAVGWRFATHANVRAHLEPLHAERPQRYSRAVMETLAVIAYRQPVTRGDIEDIRGVAVGSQIVKQLEDRGWIDCIGHRDAPGRPALYATTKQFLDDLALTSIAELPPLDGAMPSLPTQSSLLEEVDESQFQLDLSGDADSAGAGQERLPQAADGAAPDPIEPPIPSEPVVPNDSLPTLVEPEPEVLEPAGASPTQPPTVVGPPEADAADGRDPSASPYPLPSGS